MKTKEFAAFLDEIMQPMNDSELCACFEFHMEQADLELQSAIFQKEWREYETIRTKEML